MATARFGGSAVSGSSAASVTRIGVFGSAFNPPHLGHLLLAQEAIWALDLDRVLLVPTGVAPHKQITPEPGPEVRLELARLAAAEEERLEVSTVEIDRPGPSYMAETLEWVAAAEPGAELHLLLGADAAVGLPGWHRPRRVAELARIAVAAREGIGRAELDRALAEIGAAERATLLEMPSFAVSSSLIRGRAAAGRPLRFLVPDRVARMIREQRIYGEGDDD